MKIAIIWALICTFVETLLSMETIELDFDKKNDLQELSTTLKRGAVKFGKDPINIRLFISHNISDTTYAAYLILLVEYFTKETSLFLTKTEGTKGWGKQVDKLYDLYFDNYDVHKFEKSIEKAFKLNIELEKKNPLDTVFGIWKNEDISVEQIRKKAWQRTK
jgi:hypothetical protein